MSGDGAARAERARAKVNLYLHVIGRRDDGYHLLDSLVAFADIGDAVTVAPAPDLSLAVKGPFAPALAGDDGNLVLRAARALATATGTRAGAALRLVKNLPVAAGLGGGSADAAATLRALCALWKVAPDPAMLGKVALGLGADVPVCVEDRPAFIGGIGEAVAPAPALPAAGLVLVNPGIPLATPAVFKARTGPFSRPARFDRAPHDPADLALMLRERGNDLTAAATALVPQIGEVLAALAQSPACLLARMSGSGATCFGLYPDAAAAARAAAWLRERTREWWIAATRLSGS
ncbi:MAG TPA: 4-(cytidine 5'-diphospho)-2-C-methyl-D-erythritol kinase [Alphaproteobacteria bacterium]